MLNIRHFDHPSFVPIGVLHFTSILYFSKFDHIRHKRKFFLPFQISKGFQNFSFLPWLNFITINHQTTKIRSINIHWIECLDFWKIFGDHNIFLLLVIEIYVFKYVKRDIIIEIFIWSCISEIIALSDQV